MNLKNKKRFAILILLMIFLLRDTIAVPQPYGLSGYILTQSKNQMPLGTNIKIKNINSGETIEDYTYSPVPGHSGWYSEVLQSNSGDIINIYAWNRTNYGVENFTITGDTEKNVTINLSRPPEINLTIVSPLNNTNFTNTLLVNVSIDVLGTPPAENCSFILTIQGSCLNLASGETAEHNFSSVNSNFFDTWDLTASCSGFSNITVNTTCDTDSLLFYNHTKDSVYNITVNLTQSMTINLSSPKNNTKEISNNTIVFIFNVTNTNTLSNCSLYLNNNLNKTINNPELNKNINITSNLTNGIYNWSIKCVDTAHVSGSSVTYNISVEVYCPEISNIILEDPVNLLAGSVKHLYCNGTAKDSNGYNNIKSINATFYYLDGSYSADDPDNNNSHYSAICSLLNQSNNKTDFSCLFNLTYYASAGKWQCNVTVWDNEIHSNSSVINSTINELYAMEIPTELDYGSYNPNQISNVKNINIQNIGNVPINISVKGYAQNEGDNLSMICSQGNISISKERYNISSSDFNNMLNLTSYFYLIPDFTINKQTATPTSEYLYWRIFAPLGIKGECNGSLVFSITT